MNTNNKIFIFLIKLFFIGARKVGVLSEIEKNEFISQFGNSKKMIVVKNIVVQNEPVSKVFFEKQVDKIYALFVSRITKGKGLNDIIESLPIILKKNQNFVLIVAGDGPQLTICKKQASELNVMDSIIWLGLIPPYEVSSLIMSSDIFIFPSHLPEGMPMSLVEALSYGIPIVTTKVRFAVNYLAENENCIFINVGDAIDISQKVFDIISNKDLQKKMKYLNPKIVRNFKDSIVGAEFEEIYMKMLTNKNKKLHKFSVFKPL